MASSLHGVNFLVFLLLLLASCSVVVAFDGNLVSRICSGKLFVFKSLYDFAVAGTIDNLTSHTSESPKLDYYCQKPIYDDTTHRIIITVYGHGACNSSLSPQECRDCVMYAKSQMFEECTHSVGAQIRLMDCRLRYEDYQFNDG